MVFAGSYAFEKSKCCIRALAFSFFHGFHWLGAYACLGLARLGLYWIVFDWIGRWNREGAGVIVFCLYEYEMRRGNGSCVADETDSV